MIRAIEVVAQHEEQEGMDVTVERSTKWSEVEFFGIFHRAEGGLATHLLDVRVLPALAVWQALAGNLGVPFILRHPTGSEEWADRKTWTDENLIRAWLHANDVTVNLKESK